MSSVWAVSTNLDKCRLSKPLWALCATYLETPEGYVFRVMADGFFIKEVKTVYDETGKNVISMRTFANGALHSFHDLPALTLFENGRWWSKTWFKYGMKHRDHNQPAHVWMNDLVGVVAHINWYYHGKCQKDVQKIFYFGIRQQGLEWFLEQGVSEKDLCD